MDDNAIKVLRALEHRAPLDALQISSASELSVSETKGALKRLRDRGLIETTNGHGRTRYALDEEALSKQLQAV